MNGDGCISTVGRWGWGWSRRESQGVAAREKRLVVRLQGEAHHFDFDPAVDHDAPPALRQLHVARREEEQGVLADGGRVVEVGLGVVSRGSQVPTLVHVKRVTNSQ